MVLKSIAMRYDPVPSIGEFVRRENVLADDVMEALIAM
jgi:hypothetical protein